MVSGTVKNTAGVFDNLTADVVFEAVEQAIGEPVTGLLSHLSSYVNRVFELETVQKERLIAKFYRPGRWSAAGIIEEHEFVLNCGDDELSVIEPFFLSNDSTLGKATDGYMFALYPKKWGRTPELHDQNDTFARLGRLLGRLHNASERCTFDERPVLTPDEWTQYALERLLSSGVCGQRQREIATIANRALKQITPFFDDIDLTGVHGDLHPGNILERPDEGLLLIDFDDCALAPAVQDFWMLLPGNSLECRSELTEIIAGYEEFRSFNWYETNLIEPLRLMRQIYFWDWCAMQASDQRFRQLYPEWGNDNFWNRELADLHSTLELCIQPHSF